MAQTLPVSRLVQVAVNLSPQAAAGRNFGDLLILGDSNVISGLERIRDYATIAEVTQDFGATAPETLAAQLYFGQKPKPTFLSIGRYLRTATAGELQGAILNADQSALQNFTQVTSGGFHVTIDGVVHSITGMNFSVALNLNNVASIVTSALAGAASMIYTGENFVITSATTGAGVKASGLITFTGNPSPSDTVTINGITATFVASAPGANQVLIGATAQITAANLNTYLTNSLSPNLQAATYSLNGQVITVTSAQVGTAGNSFTLVESSSNINVSGGNLTGGLNASSVSFATAPSSGTDVSALMGLTSSMALPLVPGYDAETPLEAVVALDEISTKWYGLMFASSVMPTDSDNLAIAAFIESDSISRIFGVTIENTNALSALVTNDLGSLLKAAGYEQTFTQYCSSNPYAVASMFGREFSVDFNGQNTTITLMFKQEPGIVAENLNTAQANALQAKRINVYAKYNNDTSILQYATMEGPAYIDEIHGLDWLQDAVQTACFNVMYTTTTKIPQTDAGDNEFVNAISKVCDQAILNGLGAPGTWFGPIFGALQEGQFLKYGYYIYANPIALQSQSDRDARTAPPIQVAFKLAGATQDVDVIINVNR